MNYTKPKAKGAKEYPPDKQRLIPVASEGFYTQPRFTIKSNFISKTK